MQLTFAHGSDCYAFNHSWVFLFWLIWWNSKSGLKGCFVCERKFAACLSMGFPLSIESCTRRVVWLSHHVPSLHLSFSSFPLLLFPFHVSRRRDRGQTLDEREFINGYRENGWTGCGLRFAWD